MRTEIIGTTVALAFAASLVGSTALTLSMALPEWAICTVVIGSSVGLPVATGFVASLACDLATNRHRYFG